MITSDVVHAKRGGTFTYIPDLGRYSFDLRRDIIRKIALGGLCRSRPIDPPARVKYSGSEHDRRRSHITPDLDFINSGLVSQLFAFTINSTFYEYT
ncbi:hypothetical protein QTP88_027582 [Uroleucon formosanum]